MCFHYDVPITKDVLKRNRNELTKEGYAVLTDPQRRALLHGILPDGREVDLYTHHDLCDQIIDPTKCAIKMDLDLVYDRHK